MVKIKVKQDALSVLQITMSGHAGYAPHGQDLVCAGASSIAVGMMNALDEMTPGTCTFQMKEGYLDILVTKVTDDSQLLLRTLIIQLKTLQETYRKHIKITDQEV